MGTIVPLTRRTPARIKAGSAEEAALREAAEMREAARSMRIMLWTFALTALAMCGAVVACFASSWKDIWWISAFLLVFTLCKIGLANALFHVMVHYDSNRQEARLAERRSRPPERRLRRRPRQPRGGLRVAARVVPSPRPQAPV